MKHSVLHGGLIMISEGTITSFVLPLLPPSFFLPPPVCPPAGSCTQYRVLTFLAYAHFCRGL